MSTVWGYLEYRSDILSTAGDIMMHVGGIMSTMGVFSIKEVYHLL